MQNQQQSSTAEYLPEQAVSTNAKKSLRRANIEVRGSAIHRYGVFANELILPGEIIEECPVLLLPESPAPLGNYVFAWDNKHTALALGSGSIYNHSDTPNAKFSLSSDEMLRIYAIAPIYCNDEILINYGKDWFPSRNNNARIAATQAKHNRIMRIIFLSALLLLIYSFVPTFVKFHVPPFPALTNVLQKMNLGRWGSPSTVQRTQTATPFEYTTEHNETN